MSAIPEANRHEKAQDPGTSVSGGDASFSLFPDILRGAAYVSSGGRVYRLFSEEDESTILNSPLGAPLRIDPTAFDDDAAPVEPEEIVVEQTVERVTEAAEESPKPSQKADDIALAFAFEINRLESERPISMDEAIRRKRGVEGICGSIKVRKPTLGTPKPNNTQTESVRGGSCAKKPGVPLRSLEDKRPTLQLFDVLPDVVAKEARSDRPPTMDVSQPAVDRSRNIAICTKNEPSGDRAERSEAKEAATPHRGRRESEPKFYAGRNISAGEEFVLKFFETAPSGSKMKHRLVPSDKTRPIEETKEPVAEPILERKSVKIVRVNLPRIAKAVRPFTPRNTFGKSFSIKEQPMGKPSPEAFPMETMEKVGREHEHTTETRQKTSTSCRLHWNPVWPMHLASLEEDAARQIQGLVDHLQTQFDQGRKVVSFNGYRPGDGCTTMALCAARKMAERGYRLLLADAHRQHPELAFLLKLDVDPHIYEIMTLIPDRLELLPWSESFIEIDSRDAGFHGEGHTKSFTDIVVSLRDDYDGIILDGGSLIESPLSERVAQWRQMHADGVLLVVNTKNPEPVNVQAVARRLHQFNIELLGVAENYV